MFNNKKKSFLLLDYMVEKFIDFTFLKFQSLK